MNTTGFAFPKPREIYREPEHVYTFEGGREVCNRVTAAGKREYRNRTLAMLKRQEGRCCLEAYAPMCQGNLQEKEATFEHEWGRGGGKRDDRVELPDGTWINGAAHGICNAWKASRYIPYNRTFQKRGDDGRS